MLAPFHAQFQTISVYCLSSLGELDRARAIFELGTGQPLLDMPEVLWKAYIDFEIAEGENDKARELYSRLLDRTTHVKVCGVCDSFVSGTWLIHMCDAFVCGMWHVTHLYVGRGTHLYVGCVVWLICMWSVTHLFVGWLICMWDVWCDSFVCMMGLGTHLYVSCDLSLICMRDVTHSCEGCESFLDVWCHDFRRANSTAGSLIAPLTFKCAFENEGQHANAHVRMHSHSKRMHSHSMNAFSFNENAFPFNENAFSFNENAHVRMHSHSMRMHFHSIRMHSHSMRMHMCIFILRCVLIQCELSLNENAFSFNENAFSFNENVHSRKRARMRMRMQNETANENGHTCAFSFSHMCILVSENEMRDWGCTRVKYERMRVHMCDMGTCVREWECTCVTSAWENEKNEWVRMHMRDISTGVRELESTCVTSHHFTVREWECACVAWLTCIYVNTRINAFFMYTTHSYINIFHAHDKVMWLEWCALVIFMYINSTLHRIWISRLCIWRMHRCFSALRSLTCLTWLTCICEQTLNRI